MVNILFKSDRIVRMETALDVNRLTIFSNRSFNDLGIHSIVLSLMHNHEKLNIILKIANDLGVFQYLVILEQANTNGRYSF
jgi:hypothetical protein